MRSGRVSQTALKVGLLMITLNEKPGWSVIATREAPTGREIEGFAVAERS